MDYVCLLYTSGPGSLSELETERFLEITYSDITIENWCFNCRNFKHLKYKTKTRWHLVPLPNTKNKMAAKYFRCISLMCGTIIQYIFYLQVTLIYYKMNLEHTAVYSFKLLRCLNHVTSTNACDFSICIPVHTHTTENGIFLIT